MFTPSEVKSNFFVDNIAPENRGKAISVRDTGQEAFARAVVTDMKAFDANFAFLSTALAKLHTKIYEPMAFVTYDKDVPVNVGGGFVDYVEYFTVDYAGMMNEFRNVMGNNANYIPRVNASMNQKKVNVFTFEVAYDLRFVELEKFKKLTLQKSIEDIYKSAITAGWDLFVQQVAYTGLKNGHGLFNSPNVQITTIDNSSASAANSGFKGMSDEAVVSFFNGVFALYLENIGRDGSVLPDTFLLPTFVGSDLSSRMNELYSTTLRKFLEEHNLGSDESDDNIKVRFRSRSALNTLGAGGHGRIVAYKNDETFVRIDMPYPIQHYITLPNIEKMGYTSAFVGQVSEIQMPYNDSASEMGIVSYFDFTK